MPQAGEPDRGINEGTPEWIQVSESCRRLGLGRYMMCALSGRQEGIARFVTNVFLRKCSFIGTDIWPVLHPASPNG